MLEESGRDLAVELLEKYRHLWPVDEPRGYSVDYTGILVDMLLRHGYPLHNCRSVLRWYRYRKRLFSLYRRLRSGRGVPRSYLREVEYELELTMAVLAGYYLTCGDYWHKRMDGDRLASDVYAELVDCSKRLAARLRPCMEYYSADPKQLRKCYTRTIGMLLSGGNPQLILELARREKIPVTV